MIRENKRIDILNRECVIEELFNIVQSASKNQAYCPFAIWILYCRVRKNCAL